MGGSKKPKSKAKPKAKPKLGETAKKIVKFLRSNAHLAKMKFTANGKNYGAGSFAKVANAIEKGDIEIRAVRVAKIGEYWIKENVLAVDHKMIKSGGVDFYAAITHESIHAFQDMADEPLRTNVAEYAAFIAQAIYEVAEGRTFPDGDDAFPVQLAYAYGGSKKAKYTRKELWEAFKKLLPSIVDDNGKAVYGKGDYKFDGVGKDKPGATSTPASKPASGKPPTSNKTPAKKTAVK